MDHEEMSLKHLWRGVCLTRMQLRDLGKTLTEELDRINTQLRMGAPPPTPARPRGDLGAKAAFGFFAESSATRAMFDIDETKLDEPPATRAMLGVGETQREEAPPGLEAAMEARGAAAADARAAAELAERRASDLEAAMRDAAGAAERALE